MYIVNKQSQIFVQFGINKHFFKDYKFHLLVPISKNNPAYLIQIALKIITSTNSKHHRDKEIITINTNQKPIRVETCNGPLCAGKQASEYSIC